MPKLQLVNDDGSMLVEMPTRELDQDGLRAQLILYEYLRHTGLFSNSITDKQVCYAKLLARDTGLLDMGFTEDGVYTDVRYTTKYMGGAQQGVSFSAPFSKITISMLMITLEHINKLLEDKIIDVAEFNLRKLGGERNTLNCISTGEYASTLRLPEFTPHAKKILANASGKPEYILTISVAREYGSSLNKPKGE